LRHADAALSFAQEAFSNQQAGEASSSLVAARLALAQISECEIIFTDDCDFKQTSAEYCSHNSSGGFQANAVDSEYTGQTALRAAANAAQASIDEASDASRISRNFEREALLAKAKSAIADIPASPGSPAPASLLRSDLLHFSDLESVAQDDDCDDRRQRILHHAAAARSTSAVELLHFPFDSPSDELTARSRSAITIQRAWRRPILYFDSVMSASGSLNRSGEIEVVNPIADVQTGLSEADFEALSAFDEALSIFERSAGATPRSK